MDGPRKIVDPPRSSLQRVDAATLRAVDASFATVGALLAKDRTPDGVQTCDHLAPADRTALKGPITALAEDLSRLRGIPGLS